MKKIKDWLSTTGYILFRKVIRKLPKFKALEETYYKSGAYTLFDVYLAGLLFTITLTAIGSIVLSLLLHFFVFHATIFQAIVASFLLEVIVVLIVIAIFFFVPILKSRQKAKEIDENLVYTAGYMSILSAGGVPIERVFERVAEVEEKVAIKEMAKRFLTNIKMFGMDAISALKDLSKHSPSDTFSKILHGLANTVKTSEDLHDFLTYETERLLHTKREHLKRRINTLMTLGEIYVAAVVVFPIVVIVMLTILSVLGSRLLGLSTVEQLNLVVFVLLPMISLIFILLLNAALPEE